MTIRHYGFKEFGAVLLIIGILSLLVFCQKPTVMLSAEDAGTILTTARLFRLQGSQPNDPDNWFIQEMLVQLGYKNCRQADHFDEIAVCQQTITEAEIQLVREAIANPNGVGRKIIITK